MISTQIAADIFSANVNSPLDIEMNAASRLDTATLKDVLIHLANPNSLKQSPLLRSWIVQEYREAHPESTDFSAEFVIGQALESQLELWSKGYRLDPSYVSEWKGIFCLKAAYFQRDKGFKAYRKRRKLSQLGRTLADFEELARLVPGREAEADELLDAPDLQKFWYAFNPRNGEAPGPTTVSEMLKRATAHFAEWLSTQHTQKSAPPPAVRETGSVPGGASVLLASQTTATVDAVGGTNPIHLYLTTVFPQTQSYVPDEWQALISKAAATSLLVIRGKAATGKTSLLYSIGRALAKAGSVPLYVYLPDYAPFVAEMDLIRFVSVQGAFGKMYRQDTLRKDFECALAAANRDGKLVLLADGVDELFEHELTPVDARLMEIQHRALAERSLRLPLDHREAAIEAVPHLSVESLSGILQAAEVRVDAPADFCAKLDAAGLAGNLTCSIDAARAELNEPGFRPARVLSAWVEQRLKHVCQPNSSMDVLVKSRTMLGRFALLQYGMAAFQRQPEELTRDVVHKVFRSMQPLVANESEGWVLLDFVVRAGLMERLSDRWEFACSALALYFAVEQSIKEESAAIPFTPEQRQVMEWMAALLAVSRQEVPTQNFCKKIDNYLAVFSPLAALDAAEWLAEFQEPLPASIAGLRANVTDRLSALAGVASPRVQFAVWERSRRLGLAIPGPDKQQPAEAIIAPSELDVCATNLPELLTLLGISHPRDANDEWLEIPSVQIGLLEAVAVSPAPVLQRRCAAWLRRSPLSARLQVSWLPPRRISVLEAVAYLAMSKEFSAVTRTVARSILTRDEFLKRLFRLGAGYQSLVFDLMLTLDKRLYHRYDSPAWEIVG